MSLLDDYEQGIVDDVAKHGWTGVHVFDPDQRLPTFSYTIGFWETACAPEIVIFGLGRELMHSMGWTMYKRLKAGEQLADGKRWSGLLGGHDCISREVHESQIEVEYFNSALWYHEYRTGNRHLSAYQLFWPGAQQGLFPWENGCDRAVRDDQPRLDLPNEQGLA